MINHKQLPVEYKTLLLLIPDLNSKGQIAWYSISVGLSKKQNLTNLKILSDYIWNTIAMKILMFKCFLLQIEDIPVFQWKIIEFTLHKQLTRLFSPFYRVALFQDPLVPHHLFNICTQCCIQHSYCLWRKLFQHATLFSCTKGSNNRLQYQIKSC